MKKLLLVVLLLFSGEVWAATYYVGKSGSNANSCATAQSSEAGNRKLTIVAGIACLSGGDTLIIGDGIYGERISSHNRVHIPSGSAGGDTIIKAENQNQVVIAPDSAVLMDGWYYVIEIQTAASYIVFDGLVTDGSRIDGTCYNMASTVSGNFIHHITIQNGKAFNCGRGVNGGFGIGLGSHNNPGHDGYFTVRKMEIYGNIQNSTSTCYDGYGIYVASGNNLIENNDIHDNDSYGIHMYDFAFVVSNNIIRNNKIHRNGLRSSCSDGILVAKGDNNLIYNNVIYGNNHGLRVGYASTNTKIYNNTIYGNMQECIGIDSAYGTPSATTIKNNICYANGSDAIKNNGTNTVASNNLSSNPLFVNASANNFHLNVGSSAIGVGANLSEILTKDFDGTTRTVPWDIGAFTAE